VRRDGLRGHGVSGGIDAGRNRLFSTTLLEGASALLRSLENVGILALAGGTDQRFRVGWRAANLLLRDGRRSACRKIGYKNGSRAEMFCGAALTCAPLSKATRATLPRFKHRL